jgi:hypothetical protein
MLTTYFSILLVTAMADDDSGPADVGADLAGVPGAGGPPPDPNDIADPQDDVEVRCHARATTGKTPPARYLHTATCVGERLVVLGGKGAAGPLGDVHVLNMATSVWTQAKPTGDGPAPRFGHSAIVQGGNQLIVFGGMASGHATFNFGSAASSKPSIPLPFTSKQRGEAERVQECEDELFSLDLDTLTWTHETSAKGVTPSPRYKHTATAIPARKGKVRMLVFGGCDDDQAAMNDHHILDCDSMEWSALVTRGTPPAPRFGHSATLLPSRKVLVLGGTSGAKADSDAPPPDPEIPPHKTTKTLHPMCVRPRVRSCVSPPSACCCASLSHRLQR